MPLTWIFPETQKSGPIIVGKASSPIELRDPETIGKELKTYLDSHPTVPMGISIEEPNNLMEWLCK